MSFTAIGIGYGVLGFRPYWCPSPFPSPSILDVFHSLFLPSDFKRVSSLQPTYRHPFGRPFTYSLFRGVSRLGTGSGTRCCGPRGGTAVHMEQKTRTKFLPWPGLNLGPWHLAAADVATRLPRTPPFSRLLRHAGGYSRTILTANLQWLLMAKTVYRFYT